MYFLALAGEEINDRFPAFQSTHEVDNIAVIDGRVREGGCIVCKLSTLVEKANLSGVAAQPASNSTAKIAYVPFAR